jgi:Type II restriction endonuclease EcoO109I
MRKNFATVQRTFSTSGGAAGKQVIFVEACCYGIDKAPNKGTHFKLCGQRFWELISGGNETLFRDIIAPLGHLAKERNDEIEFLSAKKLNVLTADFVARFFDDGAINWDRLIQFNSGKAPVASQQAAAG